MQLSPQQTLLNRYLVHRKLGAGAMGEVWLAYDEAMDREVALKVIHREMLARPEVNARVKIECRLQARMGTHPQIIALLDRLDIDGALVLVMEYVPGEPLDVVIKRSREFNTTGGGGNTVVLTEGQTLSVITPADARVITMQCLEALEYVHSKGIVHRDVKPSNIMLHRDHKGQLRAKLMDFGIAKLVSEGEVALTVKEGMAQLTQAHVPMPGTPAYMAPEQVDPDRFGPLGPQTDLYALGATLYHMLTMSTPFTGTYTELLHAQANTTPPDPCTLNPRLDGGLREVVLKALRKLPNERYQSVGEFRIDLQVSGGGTVITGTGTHRPPPSAPARQAARRMAWLAPVAALLILGGAGAMWMSAHDAGTAQPAGATAATAPATPTPVLVEPAAGEALPAASAGMNPTRNTVPAQTGGLAPPTATDGAGAIPPAATPLPQALPTEVPVVIYTPVVTDPEVARAIDESASGRGTRPGKAQLDAWLARTDLTADLRGKVLGMRDAEQAPPAPRETPRMQTSFAPEPTRDARGEPPPEPKTEPAGAQPSNRARQPDAKRDPAPAATPKPNAWKARHEWK